jgi:hypothetical protein
MDRSDCPDVSLNFFSSWIFLGYGFGFFGGEEEFIFYLLLPLPLARVLETVPDHFLS